MAAKLNYHGSISDLNVMNEARHFNRTGIDFGTKLVSMRTPERCWIMQNAANKGLK